MDKEIILCAAIWYKDFESPVHNVKNINHTLTPLLVGVVTFFLPCGFTQAMQIYAVSTGSFWLGGLSLAIFANVFYCISAAGTTCNNKKNAYWNRLMSTLLAKPKT